MYIQLDSSAPFPVARQVKTHHFAAGLLRGRVSTQSVPAGVRISYWFAPPGSDLGALTCRFSISPSKVHCLLISDEAPLTLSTAALILKEILAKAHACFLHGHVSPRAYR